MNNTYCNLVRFPNVYSFVGATWGDDLVRVGKEDDVQSQQQDLPASYETAPDATGVRASVSFRWAGQGPDRHVEKVRVSSKLSAG